MHVDFRNEVQKYGNLLFPTIRPAKIFERRLNIYFPTTVFVVCAAYLCKKQSNYGQKY